MKLLMIKINSTHPLSFYISIMTHPLSYQKINMTPPWFIPPLPPFHKYWLVLEMFWTVIFLFHSIWWQFLESHWFINIILDKYASKEMVYNFWSVVLLYNICLIFLSNVSVMHWGTAACISISPLIHLLHNKL